MNFGTRLGNMLISNREVYSHAPAGIADIDSKYEMLNQFELGTHQTAAKMPRTRQQIYGMWEIMQRDPQIAEALSLHVTAALGGHETTGDMIFITPHDRIRGNGRRAAALRQKVEREARHIAPIINRHAFALARQAIGFGDSYARIYTDKKMGVVALMNNHRTAPPLIMPFEQADMTIGFHALESESIERTVEKLSPMQMLRVKMARIETVPQMPLQIWQDEKVLGYNNRYDMPILPAETGGSFLYHIEEAWEDVTISRAGLNNQQIADSVRQAFLSINVEGMPPAQQKKYQKSLVDTLGNYKKQIQEAFKGGEALYGTTHHVLPQWGDKQILQSIGDLSQRNAPLNEGLLMLNLRRLAGGLGIDLALIGWADMLAGGLGDGAAFHTSAQIMRRSLLIRQALIDSFNHVMSIHWGIKYGEWFVEGDYPWQYDFFSEQSAAATQTLNNKQSRANTLTIQAQAIMTLKELGLDKETAQLILEDEMGLDIGLAERIARSIAAGVDGGDGAEGGAPAPGGANTNDGFDDAGDDELPDELEDDEYEE